MDTFYEGEHSIIFGSKHSWEDWKLIPTKRYSIPPPEIDTKLVEIPGASGFLDLTSSLTGFPMYKSRECSFEFYVAHDQTDLPWDRLYAQIVGYLHGMTRQLILTDDPGYYYTGYFEVENFTSGKSYSSVSIKGTLQPYKWLRWTTLEEWMWDPFDFIYGEITQSMFKDITVTSGSQNFRRWEARHVGTAPVCPKITVSGGNMTLKIDNHGTGKGVKTFELQNGLNDNPQIMLCCPDPDDYINMTIEGSGTVSFDFRPGGI